MKKWNELAPVQRRRILLAIPVVYFVFYMITFLFLERYVVPQFIIYSRFDDYIPFCEWFLIPYFLWFPLVPATFYYFYKTNLNDYVKLCKIMLTGLTICLALYFLFPNGQNLRAPILGDNILCRLVGMLRSADTSTNVCPSIHVFVSVSLALLFQGSVELRQKHPAVRMGLILLSGLICMSTVFLKQHSIVDVACGAALSLILGAVFRCGGIGELMDAMERPRKRAFVEP